MKRLDRLKAVFGDGGAPLKLALLRTLERRSLPRAADVLRLHDILCFLRAYPDDAAILEQVERMLGSFARRADLRRHRGRLADSGIAGTTIHFRFFAPTASWLAGRWGDRLTIEWKAFRNRARLERWLPLLTLYCETPGLDEYAFETRQWIARLKGPRETDASFLIRRFDALRMDSFAREKLYDELDAPIRLAPGPGTPSRTIAKYVAPSAFQPVYQTGPLLRSRPSLHDEIARPPDAVRAVPAREARKLIDLARGAMVTRSRDLDVFSWADPSDVRLVDCGAGLQFACIGALPERRLLLESVYGFLTLKNGVPTGYVLSSALFGSSEIAYNVFETYRGGESAWVYARVLAMVRHLFGSDVFTIFPYQLGQGNEEALVTGAWWFYQKMGFRPEDPGAIRLMRRELRRMRTDTRHRSSVATLERLGAHNLFFFLGKPRRDVMGTLSLADVGLRISTYIAGRFGSDRERASRTCAREAADRLGVRSLRGFSPGERLAWQRWSPLVLILPGVEAWSGADRRALVAVVRAKGGPRESEFVRLFDRHRRLRRAVASLARTDD